MAYYDEGLIKENFAKRLNQVDGIMITTADASVLLSLSMYDTPKADVVEVNHGYWKDRYGNKYDNHLYECSICGKDALGESYCDELGQSRIRQALTPICPRCGAIMDGKEEKHE